MTTEEERKAAAEKLVRLIAPSYADDELAIGVADRLLSGNGSLSIDKAIDLQCALTRTEKRLEVAEGMLREIAPHMNEMSKEAYHRLAPKVHAFVTHPPAEGE